MTESGDYILQVGEKAAQRLSILHEILSGHTARFLDSVGINQSCKVLEVGCGTGNVSMMIADRLGPGCRLIATDISEEQLAIAEHNASLRNIKNIDFVKYSITEPPIKLSEVDLVYSRLTVMHMSNPFHALKNMSGFLKNGGVMACEEASNAYYMHEPYNEAYDTSRKILLKLFDMKGLDPYIGDKLKGYFDQLELNDIKVSSVQPIYKTQQERSAVSQFFEEVKSNYINYGLITEQEALEIANKIKVFLRDEKSVVSFPRLTQIFGRK